jgi:large subunit ribosomal protein L6
MSRIGLKPIILPSGVTVTTQDQVVLIKGPKGELKVQLHPGLTLSQTENKVKIEAEAIEGVRPFHGLVRSLLSNAVVGVTEGYKKTLKLIGTGYRVAQKGGELQLAVGFSHPVVVKPLTGTTIKAEGNDTIHIEGIDKQSVGQMAAVLRAVRPPEPYKGKGIRYEDEVVRKKAGKATAK